MFTMEQAMVLPNAARNLVSTFCLTLWRYKQPLISIQTAWYSVEFEKINFLKWHIYQTKLTNYQNLRFVMPGGHAFSETELQ